jgi:hypothetical protein
MDRIENDVSNNFSIVVRIRCRGNMFTGPLPSTKWRDTPNQATALQQQGDTHADTHTDGRYL